MRIIDCHTHAFPDAIAQRAMETLCAGVPEIPPQHDGTIKGLLGNMDDAGVHGAVIANIATKVTQERPIIEWSKQIASDRIIPFISFHPDGDDHDALLDEAAEAGIRGVKFHCLYQDFIVDEDRAMPMYEKIAKRGLAVLFHAGQDFCWPETDHASPARLLNIHHQVPSLKMIAAHCGGWRMWDDVADMLAGEDIILELSFIGEIADETWERIWAKHPRDRFVFGSDTPWTNERETLDDVRRRVSEDDFLQITARNPAALLGLPD